MKSKFFFVVSEASRASHLHSYFSLYFLGGGDLFMCSVYKRNGLLIASFGGKKKGCIISRRGGESFKANACNTGAY